MRTNILGKYREDDSFLHKLNPQVKIISSIYFSLISIIFSDFRLLILLILMLLIGVKLGKISLKNFFYGIRPVLYVAIFTIIFQILFTKNGELIYKLGILEIYSGTLWNSLLVLMRFTVLIGMAFILTYTTSPIEITHGLEDLFSPLKKLGIPVAEMALVISIALRFIPIFFSEAERIRICQASKGWDVEELKFLEKICYYGSIFIPLLSSALSRSEELANAMEIKGYGIKNIKTRFRSYSFRNYDIYFLFIVIVAPLLERII